MTERIAYVVNAFPKTSEAFIAEEMAELLRRGTQLRILSLRLPEEEPRHDIVSRAGLLQHVSYDASEFRLLLRSFQPDLVHAHFATKPTAAGREIAAELGVPFTFTAHRYDIYDRPPKDFADRAGAAGAVITVSEANARYISQRFGVPSSKLRIIPCGVDTERFRPGRRATPPHIVCVARLKPFKNQALLLEACDRLRRKGLRFHCVLVGDGPSRDDLHTLRSHFQLERIVDFVGAADQTEVRGWWQRAALAVLPSDSEGAPVCLMEAAACGVPAVATDVGGVGEIVEDGSTGVLLPPGDADALAEALEDLLRDEPKAARLGEAARRRAVERFSVTRQVDALLGLWQDLPSGVVR